MVVLSAAVTNRSGKALVSRQFVEMTRIRIEGLLAAFPKLVGSDSKQHTYVETESVRYLYQPLDNLFLLLVTNRASNIVEDLDTLRLLSKVVPDVIETANNISEEKISEKCFELIFAFDEVITAGGYREPITLQQIRSNLEMDSHEERLQLMIKQTKIDAAQDQARSAAESIREQKASGMVGIGGGQGPHSGAAYNTSSPYDSAPEPVVQKPVRAKKGMSLGAKKNTSLEESLFKEDKLAPVLAKAPIAAASATAMPVVPQQVQHPIMLALAERVSATVTRDGTVNAFDIKGSLTLTAADDDAALCAVQLNVSDADAFTFMTHPKVSKSVYDQSQLIQLKDTSKGFPSARPVGILRWNHSSTSDELMPLKINCWPEEESRGTMNVSIEYTMEQSLTLQNVRIVIPLGTSEPPNILNVDGNHRFDAKEGELTWEIDMIDADNNSGSMEFNVQQRDSDAFFPISVDFASPELYCNVEIASVRSSQTNGAIQYGLSKGLLSDEYQIV
eukprot:GSChrysophyteH1.ASY1.ANO1.1254.1 assembled CDS